VAVPFTDLSVAENDAYEEVLYGIEGVLATHFASPLHP